MPETLTLAAAAGGGGADAAEAFVAGIKDFFLSLAAPGGLGCRGAWWLAAWWERRVTSCARVGVEEPRLWEREGRAGCGEERGRGVGVRGVDT